jgi:tRNA threonylcarbamoyladenosine biosynthesis protein TsaE
METRQLQIENLTELEAFAQTILESVADTDRTQAQVIALHGDLGAGKTTLVQLFGKHLGVEEIITSPTFTILKSYDTAHEDFTTLIHIDAYRIDDETELRPLQFNEYLSDPHTLVCIEWAEKIAGSLPANRIDIALQITDTEARTVQVSRRQG